MTERPLPDRRENTTHRVKIGPAKVYVTLGFYPDDPPTVGEIFISLEKTGSERRWLMDEVARLASKLLQHGCSVEEVATGWIGTKGSPCGPVQGDERIKSCTSVLDYVGKHLLITYAGRDDLAHVAKKETA